MPKSKKKRSHSSELESAKRVPQSCILHVVGIDHGPFITLMNVYGEATEKPEQLHKIRSQRLAESPGSQLRMETVCRLIPDSLEGLDLDSYGYHRQCYQRFHANLNRLTGSGTSGDATTSRHHSPRKLPSTMAAGTSSTQLFSPECIFCEKLEKKVHGKTVRPVMFASWNKDSAWQHMETQAIEPQPGTWYGSPCLRSTVSSILP